MSDHCLGGGGEIIRAMSERMHSFPQESVPIKSRLINLTLAVHFGTDVDVGVKESKRNILVAAENLKRASSQFLLF